MKKYILCIVLLLLITACGSNNVDKTDYNTGKNETPVNSKGRMIKWSNISLGDYIPKPLSSNGLINANTDDTLNLIIFDITGEQYDDYVNECIEMGYNIDKEILSSSFSAYNENGYELKLSFNEKETSINILLSKEKEYPALQWPTTGYATLIPKPNSEFGNIETNKDNELIIYVGKMSKDDFNEYIKTCEENGFTIDELKDKEYFYAKNKDGYRLYVTYEGNSVIKINMLEPEYDVVFDIECDENIIFSKYDVLVYIDGNKMGKLAHGTKEKYTVTMKKGTYEVRFVNDEDSDVKGYLNVDVTKNETIKIQIHCNSSKIETTLISGGKINTKETSTPTSSVSPSNTPVITISPTPKPTITPKPTATPKPSSSNECVGLDYEILAKKYFEKAGKKFYPYGIKFHWILDWKEFKNKGKCVYHIEVGVDVTNMFGAKRKGVAKGDVDFKKGEVRNFIVD